MRNKKATLTPEAIADGAKSGLTKADMTKLGMYSIDKKEMSVRFHKESEGYIIPYENKFITSNDDFCRAKLLTRVGKFGEIYKQKYSQQKGSIPHLYLPEIGKINWKKVAENPAETIFITEGEKKAAAACKAGYNCIGLAGIWCFKSKNESFLSDWDYFTLTDRQVFIVYDSDIVDKPEVQYAEYALSVELVARGAKVKRIRLPNSGNGEKVGLDDFFVANGFPDSLQPAKAAFEQLPREEINIAVPPHLSDLGNAIRFGQEFSDILKYVPQWKSWFYYNKKNGIWQIDLDGGAMRCAKRIPYILRKHAEKVDNEKTKANFLKWAKTSESEKGLNSMIRLAQSELDLILPHTEIDANLWEVAFANGTAINLKSGVVRKIIPEDFFSTTLAAEYNPQAKCPQWEKFLHEIMKGDKELIRFIQRVIGWCLTGDVSEQCFFILYGTGANGKSTFLNTILAMFGDYGRQANPNSFMSLKNESPIRSDIVRLRGVRFIATSETEEHQKLSESFIKQWTGGEQISTRDLHVKQLEFTPQGKIFLATNHKPKIYGNDHAIWRRVILFPFKRTFLDAEKDIELPNKLKAELSGILNWALEGCFEWQKHGLMRPESVNVAVNSYREEMDVIGSWLEDSCEIVPEQKELIAKLHENYKEWAKNSAEYVVTRKEFTRKMLDRGYDKVQTTDRIKQEKGWFIKGVFLKNKANPPKFIATPDPVKKGK